MIKKNPFDRPDPSYAVDYIKHALNIDVPQNKAVIYIRWALSNDVKLLKRLKTDDREIVMKLNTLESMNQGYERYIFRRKWQLT